MARVDTLRLPASSRVIMPRLLLVSNRLPVTVKTERGELSVQVSSGGLASGLAGPHQASGGLWLGWPGDTTKLSPPQIAQLEKQLEKERCIPLYLTTSEVNRFYEGFANRILWPLFHYLVDRLPLTTKDWGIYKTVNAKFADLVAKHYEQGDTVWVHDYQLLLVPGMLRERLGPSARIGFFLHIPFPAPDIFRVLPWRREVLEGLMGADVVGFHTESFAKSVRGGFAKRFSYNALSVNRVALRLRARNRIARLIPPAMRML